MIHIEMISLHNTRRYVYISRRTDASNHIEIPISILNFVTSCVQVSGNSKVNSMGGEKQRLSKLHVSQRRITSPSVCIEACFDSFSSARIRTAYLRTCTDARTRASRIRSVD